MKQVLFLSTNPQVHATIYIRCRWHRTPPLLMTRYMRPTHHRVEFHVRGRKPSSLSKKNPFTAISFLLLLLSFRSADRWKRNWIHCAALFAVATVFRLVFKRSLNKKQIVMSIVAFVPGSFSTANKFARYPDKNSGDSILFVRLIAGNREAITLKGFLVGFSILS